MPSCAPPTLYYVLPLLAWTLLVVSAVLLLFQLLFSGRLLSVFDSPQFSLYAAASVRRFMSSTPFSDCSAQWTPSLWGATLVRFFAQFASSIHLRVTFAFLGSVGRSTIRRHTRSVVPPWAFQAAWHDPGIRCTRLVQTLSSLMHSRW